MSSPCFGIDLGTTTSAISLVESGTPRLLEVDGATLLPSAVLYPPGEPVLVGQPAINALPLTPERGVLSSKRHIGTEHRWDIGGEKVSPVDVAEQILRSLARGAEQSIGYPVERVVITVPAWFTQAQRADTRLAGERAGLKVERIINEPTAAALAHAHGQELRRRVLVYDLGGGTFDVSVVEQDGALVEVRASHGDSRLGGDDIDLALVDLVLRRVAETDRALRDAIDDSPAARIRLRLAVEQAKIALSTDLDTTLRVPFLLELDGRPRHLELKLDRDDLDAVAEPLIARTLASVDQVLADAGLRADELDELLLVGGATLQPLVWHTLHRRYGLEGSHAIDARRVVALGAAIQGAICDGSRTDGILLDVAPYAISMGSAHRNGFGVPDRFLCHVLTPRNSPLPSRHTERVSTLSPRQRLLRIPVFQGSAEDPRRNTVLGEVILDELEPAPPGHDGRPIRVEFRHDLDGMVQIQVTDELSGRSVSGRVAADGDEQEALRRDVEQHAIDAGMAYGWDDPLDDEDGIEHGAFGAGFAPEVHAEEARQTFEAVVAAHSKLEAEHPKQAAWLRDLAIQGISALQGGDETAALARYDQLSDDLFALGVYL